MPTSSPPVPLRVLIVGAGIGGLCLAQGLTKAGIAVAVHERDRSAVVRDQGYRISLKEEGTAALRACLPRHLYDLCAATAIRQATRMIVMDHRLRPKFSKPLPPPERADAAFGVHRQTLREILLAGLGGAVRFGSAFERFERLPGGRVRAAFADGAAATCDLLVGADGTGSAVRAQLLPGARLDDLGTFLYGRTVIGPDTLSWTPPELVDSFNRMTGPDGVGLSVATCRTREPVAAAAARLAPGLRLTAVPGSLAWTLDGWPLEDQPRGGGAAAGEALHRLARRTLRGWPDPVRRIVDEAEPAATFLVRRAAARPVGRWPAGGVTLLGDAIHTMTPGRGEGANTALRDAALLRSALVGVVARGVPLAAATSGYEAEMLRYGFEAIEASRRLPFMVPRPAWADRPGAR